MPEQLAETSLNSLTATRVWLGIGWTLLFLLLVALSIVFSSLWNKFSRILSIGEIRKPTHGTPDDNTGKLPKLVPKIYDFNVALYLKDSMARYMNYVTGDTPEYVARPFQKVLAIVSVGKASDIVSVVLEDTSSEAIIILFKGSTTAVNWNDDLHTLQEPLRPTAFPGVLVDSGFQRSYFQSRATIIDCLKNSKFQTVYVL